MTEKELSKYYWLKREVKNLEERLEEFGSGLKAMNIESETGSSSVHTSIQQRRAELVKRIINDRLTALEEYIKIESYIEKVEDSEIRQIMRYRFLDLYGWYKIGDLMNYDRTTCSKKLRTYIKNSHNSHSEVI